MGRIHKYYSFIYETGFYALFQYLLEDALKQVGVLKAPPVVLPECTKMRYRVMQPQAKKPAVRIVYLDFLNGLPHTSDSKHILYDRQLG